jgi:hypothetical protein
MNIRVLAIDWSGDVRHAARKIWLAEAAAGELRRLADGRDRDQVTQYLIDEQQRGPNLIVGLDFAFSFPLGFCEARHLTDISDVWDLAEREGEQWLRDCMPPFWGRAGTRSPRGKSGFRATELAVIQAVPGARPKSILQICGAGAVGTGSIRGMPFLKRLRQKGFAIWPFDAAKVPCVVEIYPRALTKAVNKSSREQRLEYLNGNYRALSPALLERAASNEDAFDAAVSALVMAKHIEDIQSLSPAIDTPRRLEGAIWYPSDQSAC